MKNVILDNEFYSIELAGGKGYNLNILKENNINVPDFFVISSEIYELYLEDKLDVSYIKNCIKEYCNKHFKKGTLYSIRSSANIEDSENNSYAGQFRSFLNVKQNDIFKYVQKCWEYAKTKKEVILSSKEKNDNVKNNLKMSVIVQEMVFSDVSGIGFTANPEGILNEAVVTAGKGLGNNIVEDKIPTVTYYYNLNDDIYYFEKQDGAIELKKENLEQIIENLKQIKKIYKKDMDVEWAIYNNELYILQARPITTLNDKEIIVLDNSNIVESYPNISLPLTQSFVKRLYSFVFKEIFKKLLGEKEIEKHVDIFTNILESANGRVYYRISNWYTFFQFLPFSDRIIKSWQEMLGILDKKIVYDKKEIGAFLKLRLLFKAISLFLNNNKNMANNPEGYEKLLSKYSEKLINKKEYSNKELLEIHDVFVFETIENGTYTLVNDMYAVIFISLVKRLSENKAFEEDVNKYISNISNLESIKPVVMLNEITKNIRGDKELYSEFINIKTNDEFDKFIEKNSDKFFIKDIKKYINAYGDRVLEELKFETKTYKTDPILLVDKIKNNNIETYENSISDDSKIQDIQIKNIKCNFILKWCMKNVTKGISQREESRLYRTKCFGIDREITIQMAENFQKSGILENNDDIFYLEYEEIKNYIDNENINLKEIVKKRKKEYKEFEKIPNYSRLVFSGKIVNKKIHSDSVINYEKSNLLVGTPVSSGVVNSECLIIDDVKNIGDVKDKILVTKSTDPGWAFLLKDAKGLISERGSLLSHTAIISRELGIPAVVNIKNATNILKNGDFVKLDADNGEIEILKKLR